MMMYVLTVVVIVCDKCPTDLCDAVYNDARAVFREDDGDIVTISTGTSSTCLSMDATCIGETCHACKCRSDMNTYNNHKGRCQNFDKSESNMQLFL